MNKYQVNEWMNDRERQKGMNEWMNELNNYKSMNGII